MLARYCGKCSDYASVILRLALAAVLINHGYIKLFGGLADTASFFASVGIPAASIMAVVVAFVEFFGGIAILLGLFSRVAALLVALEFVILLLLRLIPGSLPAEWSSQVELEVLILAVSIALLWMGSAKLSLERALFRKELL